MALVRAIARSGLRDLTLVAGYGGPDIGILARLLDSYRSQSPAESASYAQGSAERQAWQGLADVRGRLPAA